MGIEITSSGVSKTYRYYPYDAFYVDANGNVNTSGNGQQVKEAWFNGVKYYPVGVKPPARIEIIRKPTLSDYSDIVVQAYTADNEVWYNESYPNGIIPFNQLTFYRGTGEASIIASAKSYFPNGIVFNRATSRIMVDNWNWTKRYDMEEIDGGKDFRVYCCGFYDSEVGNLYVVPYLVVNKNTYPVGSSIPKGTRVLVTSRSGVFIYVPTKYDAVLKVENDAYFYNNQGYWYRVAIEQAMFMGSNGWVTVCTGDYDMANYIVDGEVNTFTSHPDSQHIYRTNEVENLLIYCVDGIRNYFTGSASAGYKKTTALIGMLKDFWASWRVPGTSTTLSDSCCLDIDVPFPLGW